MGRDKEVVLNHHTKPKAFEVEEDLTKRYYVQ